jgi:DNA-binding PadR family transcriptional regulator
VSSFGTLYRALSRLEAMGCVTSRWEEPADAAAERRPPRRLYLLTAAGKGAIVAALASERKTVLRRARRKWAPA